MIKYLSAESGSLIKSENCKAIMYLNGMQLCPNGWDMTKCENQTIPETTTDPCKNGIFTLGDLSLQFGVNDALAAGGFRLKQVIWKNEHFVPKSSQQFEYTTVPNGPYRSAFVCSFTSFGNKSQTTGIWKMIKFDTFAVQINEFKQPESFN